LHADKIPVPDLSKTMLLSEKGKKREKQGRREGLTGRGME